MASTSKSKAPTDCVPSTISRAPTLLLLSRIGTPINEPQAATVQLLPERGKVSESMVRKAERIVAGELARINTFCRELSRGKYPIC